LAYRNAAECNRVEQIGHIGEQKGNMREAVGPRLIVDRAYGAQKGRALGTKRRILLVDDEVAVLLTMKAVLEISGFDVDTATSARDGKLKLRKFEYDMVITDMRMESEEAGVDVVKAARAASYQPAVAMLTAFPTDDEGWQYTGADKMLVKPMQTRVLLQQIEKLLETHETKKAKAAAVPAVPETTVAKSVGKKAVSKRSALKKAAPKHTTSGK